MATAFYTARVENQYGEWMEFEVEYDFDPEDWDGEEFDPEDSAVQTALYQEVMDNLYVDIEFDRIDD